jgi:hypothetical protein
VRHPLLLVLLGLPPDFCRQQYLLLLTAAAALEIPQRYSYPL